MQEVRCEFKKRLIRSYAGFLMKFIHEILGQGKQNHYSQFNLGHRIGARSADKFCLMIGSCR